MVKYKILELRNQGKTYEQIANELNCAESTVAYHCSQKTREKVKKRATEYKAKNPLIKKLDNFNQSYKKKGIDNKLTHFKSRGGKESNVSLKMILEKFGASPTCYLTGTIIDLAEPSTYSFDHKIPVAKGGDNSFENLGICIRDVNMAKCDMTPEEFIELCKKVLIHNGYNVNK